MPCKAIPRAQIPPEIPVTAGTQLQMQTPDGRAVPVVVADATDEHVMIDANHPLAGKDLTFAVEIVKVD